jgi:TolA-binding protein
MRLSYLLVLSVLLVAACKSPKEKKIDYINSLEASDSAYSVSQMTELYWNYIDFADRYPDDSRTPEFLVKAAQRSSSLSKAAEGISLLERLLKNYPDSKFCEQALFTMAFNYENHLNDFDKARQLYNEFLQKYPKSELADDAKLSLDALGKSPEEFLDLIQKDSTLDKQQP